MSLEQRLADLLERVERLENRNEALEKKNYELEKRLEGSEYRKEQKTNETDNEVSRRGFLKKLGAGAVGLGGLSLVPVASRLKITKDSIEGSSDLNLISDSSGNSTLNLKYDSYTRLNSRSGQPFQIYDQDGQFIAAEYISSSTQPGVLELKNAKLRCLGVDGNRESLYVEDDLRIGRKGNGYPNSGRLILEEGEEGDGTGWFRLSEAEIEAQDAYDNRVTLT